MSARDEFGYTDADRRYNNLIEDITELVGDKWELVHQLDAIVGERLVEHEDRGCAPRIIEAEHRVEELDLEVARMRLDLERLQTVLAMMGHLADQRVDAP